jgi:hypothetical protein
MGQRLFDIDVTQTLRPESAEVARLAEFLLDEAYVAWSAALEDCDEAYSAWARSRAGDRAARYARFVAALEREEAAASELKMACAAVSDE